MRIIVDYWVDDRLLEEILDEDEEGDCEIYREVMWEAYRRAHAKLKKRIEDALGDWLDSHGLSQVEVIVQGNPSVSGATFVPDDELARRIADDVDEVIYNCEMEWLEQDLWDLSEQQAAETEHELRCAACPTKSDGGESGWPASGTRSGARGAGGGLRP